MGSNGKMWGCGILNNLNYTDSNNPMMMVRNNCDFKETIFEGPNVNSFDDEYVWQNLKNFITNRHIVASSFGPLKATNNTPFNLIAYQTYGIVDVLELTFMRNNFEDDRRED